MKYTQKLVVVREGVLSHARPPFRVLEKWVEASSPLVRDVINPLRGCVVEVRQVSVPTDFAVAARHMALRLGLRP